MRCILSDRRGFVPVYNVCVIDDVTNLTLNRRMHEALAGLLSEIDLDENVPEERVIAGLRDRLMKRVEEK